MSLEDFEIYMRKEKKVKKYDDYVEGFRLFQQFLQQQNLKLELVNESILSDYFEYIYDDYQNWVTYNSSYGNYILRFYLSFVGKEELVTHLDKLKQIYEPKSKEFKKELMNQPKFVINLEKELNKHLSQDKVNQILEGKENIKQNSSPKKKSCYICQVMQKMEMN